MIRKKVLILLVCILPLFFCCRTNSASQRQHKVEKQKEEKNSELEKKYAEAKEKHLKNQTKQTKNRMKANKGKSDDVNYQKKEFFLKRWFTRKPNTCVKTTE